MVRQKEIFIPAFIIVTLTAHFPMGCSANHSSRLSLPENGGNYISKQLAADIDTVGLIATVRLSWAKVAGNWPITSQGTKVKEEVVIEKRVYTRALLELRGEVMQVLKGSLNRSTLQFDIPTVNLLADRNRVVLEKPASNIPDLIIGEEYIVMLKDSNSTELYFNNIWPIQSQEARAIRRYIKDQGQ